MTRDRVAVSDTAQSATALAAVTRDRSAPSALVVVNRDGLPIALVTIHNTTLVALRTETHAQLLALQSQRAAAQAHHDVLALAANSPDASGPMVKEWIENAATLASVEQATVTAERLFAFLYDAPDRAALKAAYRDACARVHAGDEHAEDDMLAAGDAYRSLLDQECAARFAAVDPPTKHCRTCRWPTRGWKDFCSKKCRAAYDDLGDLDLGLGVRECAWCNRLYRDHGDQLVDGLPLEFCQFACAAATPADLDDFVDVDWLKIQILPGAPPRTLAARERWLREALAQHQQRQAHVDPIPPSQRLALPALARAPLTDRIADILASGPLTVDEIRKRLRVRKTDVNDALGTLMAQERVVPDAGRGVRGSPVRFHVKDPAGA